MEEELGPLNIRSVGLVRRGAPGTFFEYEAMEAAAQARRLEEEKRDPLDTFIGKMEEFRPKCPVEVVEDSWTKLTKWFVDLTPEIPILPKE